MVMGGLEYRREMNRNYMVICPKAEWNGAYTIRMLSRNRISGLLDFQEKGMNGVSWYYYDITSKQPLSRILEHRNMTVKEIRTLLSDFIYALKQMERFLLDEQQIKIEPEYIYIEPETFHSSFCLIPGYRQDFSDSLFAFSQYILDHIDYSDGDAVILAFSIFRVCKQDNFGIQDLERCLGEKSEHSEPAVEQETKIMDEKQVWEELEIAGQNRDFTEIYTKNRPILCVGSLGIVVSILIVIIIMISLRRYVMVDWKIWIAAVLLVSLAGIFWLSRLEIPSKEQEEREDAPVKREEYKLWDMDLPEEEDDEFQTVLLTSPAEQEKQMKRRLTVADGSIDIEISYFPFLIGKSKSMSDFWLDEPGVSRLHVKLEELGGDYMVTDLNSTNGTKVNGSLLGANESKRISPGDELMIADTKFVFR